MGIEFAAFAQSDLRGTAATVLHHDDVNLQFQDWPLIEERWLFSAIAKMSAFERDLMLRHKIVAYAWHPIGVTYCVVDVSAYNEALRRGLMLHGRISPELYRKLVRRHFSVGLEQAAVHRLSRLKPRMSAHKRLSGPQALVATTALVVMAMLAVAFTIFEFVTLLQIAAFVFFAIVVGLRCLCLMPPPLREDFQPPPLPDEALPVYTVLVPLFREISVLDKLVHALSLLDYPLEKLDIKIILEESDRPMQMAVHLRRLPSHFDVIVVPRGKPQTKPRALNFAVQFARGALVTIYDGEDFPQPNQLRLAAAAFAASDHNLGCVQASLGFFNPDENWLTRGIRAQMPQQFSCA